MKTHMSPKEELRLADARMMADIIKRARAAYAALPESAKRTHVRRIEDDAQGE